MYPSVIIGVRVLRVCNHGSESVESVCVYIYISFGYNRSESVESVYPWVIIQVRVYWGVIVQQLVQSWHQEVNIPPPSPSFPTLLSVPTLQQDLLAPA